MSGDKKPFERLPKNVIPKNYNLTLKPNLKAFTFDGDETISVEVKTATDKVVLNCLDIEISSATYKTGDKSESATVTYSKEDETATLTFPNQLEVGNGELGIVFTGELNDKMKGFYRSKYSAPGGEERYCAVTQFEATDARRAFPCWDEPAIKATFDITLIAPKDRVALSNMPVIEEKPNDKDANLREVKYDTTPIMSTYLLAFIVGEFDYVEDKSSDGVLVRVYTPVDKKEQGKFALEVATKTLPFYKDYFDIAYPLPKVDLIAIPDFAAGAMENWGLITYRETALLVDPKNSSAMAKQWVALVVGHELAHQWFGNLVTMEWWTHLWLNEGFASWIEYLCVDHCLPEYDIWTQFVTNDYTRALELDALKNSHPIEVPVGHPSEVDEIFDLISYSKGASVIRMLHDYIGDEDFKKGMNAYLTKHAYKNTFTEDLWASLGEACGKPIEDIMSTWTKQMGFPVIKVSAKQEGNSRVLTLTQSKFCADGASEGDKTQWMVPISISTSANPSKAALKIVLDKPTTTVTIDNVAPDQWVKLNPGTVGFYRTQYSAEMLDLLMPAIKDRSLPARDRLGLINDQFALAKAGETSTVEVLRLMDAYKNETNYTVWTDICNTLGTLSGLLIHTDFHDSLKGFGRTLLSPVAERLTWDAKDGEGHLDSLLRSLVILRLGRFGHPEIVAEAKKKFEAHASGQEKIPADLRSPVYHGVLAHADEETYKAVIKLYKEQDLHEERERIMRAIGAVKDKALIQKVLDFSLSDDVRSQDTVFVLTGVVGSKDGLEMAWKFLQDRWDELHKRYEGGFLLSRLVKYCTEGFASEERAKEIEEFFKNHKAPAAERTIQQSLENIRLNMKWLARDSDKIKSFLTSKAE
ncbi:puromycin-sensitive aminopeptidase-like [Ptychodera flava]|uniref:puromycin-sensitive aminopeptidase-like n=1 Tax=Ptychodera flava TaxID=63121 RepID=UPI00396A1ADB